LPAERLLDGGLGTLPLAPISAVTEADLPHVIARMKDRLSGRMQRPRAERLWMATYVLMGLRYSEALANQLLQEVLTMEESVTYQGIIRRGKVEGERQALLRLGRKHFGDPPAEVVAALDAIQEIQKLEELLLRVEEVASWPELLDLPAPWARSRRGKRKP
jgi:hypothetical protein